MCYAEIFRKMEVNPELADFLDSANRMPQPWYGCVRLELNRSCEKSVDRFRNQMRYKESKLRLESESWKKRLDARN